MIQKIDIKVSVIVPVYNGEKWLNKCLRSLVNQTLKEIQIICVNDFSKDNSLSILQEYAKKDKRIVIKNLKKNYGESTARNKGLKIAKGKYIAFVDQDDYVDLNFYEKLYEQTKNKNIDIVKGNVIIKESGVENINTLHYKTKKNKFNFYNCWWSAIYRTKFLQNNNINLPENLILGGDSVFLLKAVINANRVKTVDNSYYHYIKRVNSGYSKMLNYKKIHSLFLMSLSLFSYFNSSKIDRKNYTILFCYFFDLFLKSFNKSHSKKNKEFICEKTIEIYEKCKYKSLFAERYILEFLDCLNTSNKARLFTLLQESYLSISYPKIVLNNQRKYIYVWGKGKDSENVVWQCKKNNWNIAGFLDSNKKMGTISPSKIFKQKIKNYFIIISSRKYWQEIAYACKSAGLKERIDFWKPC
jgi:glycosyltransferase involved in cell wall biosynthesis